MIRELINRILQLQESLRQKYGRPKTLSEQLEERWGEGPGASEPALQKAGQEDSWELKPMFQEDAAYNRAVFARITESYSRLRREFEEMTKEDGNKQAYLRCADQFLEKINKLSQKEAFADAGKLAGSLGRILENTLLKIWEYQNSSSLIQKYMQQWGIQSKSFEAGYYLTDDDWEYLNDLSVEFGLEKTEDPSRNYEVIQMQRPVFFIAYLSDEELEYEYIPGQCRYYRYLG